MDKINSRKFNEWRIRRERIRKILKQPKGEKYWMLYSELFSYTVKHENRINYRIEKIINDFYNDDKKILKNMRICEIIEELTMLNFINLININEEYIRVDYYKYVLHMEAIKTSLEDNLLVDKVIAFLFEKLLEIFKEILNKKW